MAYTLSGAGFLGQASGNGQKVITVQQVAQALINKIVNFSIPVVGGNLGTLIPDSMEAILVNVASSMLQKEFADALDIAKAEEAHTDMIGFILAQEVGDLMYNNGILFNDDSTDYVLCKGTGAVWVGMIGDSWQSPGQLAKFISNKLEDVVTELTGVEPSAPPSDFEFETEKGYTRKTIMEEAGPGEISRVQTTPQVFTPTPVTTAGELPMVPIAIAGIAALLLLG